MRRRFPFTVIVATVALFGAALWHGCAVYDKSLLDAGTDGAGDVIDGGFVCNHAKWPTRPAADDPSTKDYDFVNALSTLDFGVGPDGGSVGGYDLDGLCTCPDREACIVVDDGGSHCDEDGGTDNAGLGLMRQFASYNGFLDQAYINKQLAGGFYGALFRLKGYNGTQNDTKVELFVFVTNGTEGIQTGFPTKPKNDGTDLWTIDPSSLLGGTITDAGPVPAEAYDLNAYVKEGYLVATLSFPVSIGSGTGEGNVTFDLSDAVVVAKLIPFAGSFRVDDAIVTGRWPTSKLLTSLAVLKDPFDKAQYLCGSNVTYITVKPRICTFADVPKNLLEDGKNAPCDAISIGFRFTSYPAKYGSLFARVDGGAGCGPTWQDSCQ